MYSIQKDLDTLKTTKLASLEYYDFKKTVQSNFSKLDNIDYLLQAFKSLEEQVYKDLHHHKTSSEARISSIESNLHFKLTPTNTQLLKMIEQKVDREELQGVEQRKVDRRELEDRMGELRESEVIKRGETQEWDLSEYATVDHVNTALKEIH
jgi:hypothetical protein